MAWYLHMTYAHPPVSFESSLDYLLYLIQCTRYVNSCNTIFFTDQLSGLFKKNLWFVESVDA